MALNYERDIKIEETALDVEWLQQPALALKYGENAAMLRKKANFAEQKVKVVFAELIKTVNADPAAFGLKEKPSVSVVESIVRSTDEHKKAKQEWIEADYEATYAEHAQKEVSFSRKQALENLVILHGQQYFAGPSMPRNISEEFQKRKQLQEKVDNGVNQAIKRRTK